jgi:parallel beta-helix repeat protein
MTLSSRANVTATNMTIEGFHCGIIVNSSLYGYDPHNINIIGNNITGNYIGIKMQDGWSSNLSRNSIRKNWTGIWISNYMYNQIRGNDLTENSYGIFLGSDYNTISFNNITASNLYGIQIMGDYNDVDSNNITNNYWGLDLTCSDYCSITGNNIAYNNMYPHAGYARGIRLIGCSDTWIYCNNFTNNTAHVQSNSLLSVWDYRKRGNYWSDYKARYPNAIANLTSGTWDTPYIIDVNNTDHYPLVNPVPNIPEFSSILLVPLFMSTTLIAIALCRRKRETDC